MLAFKATIRFIDLFKTILLDVTSDEKNVDSQHMKS